MSTVVEKCPGCGYVLKYNVEKQNWSCEYCKKTYQLEELSNKEIENISPLDSYSCPNCGAAILCNGDSITSDCLYCSSPVIIQNRISGDFKPNFILPFAHSKEDIKDVFHNTKLFLHEKQYFQKENIVSIEGMYVPYWLVSSEVSVSLHGTIMKDKDRTLYFRRKGTISFKRVPIVAKTSLLEEDLFQLEPFDYSKLKPFRHSYLSGFYAEKYDTSKDEAYENEMKMRLEKTSLEKILRYGKNFHESDLFSKKISIFNSSFEYALVPIWILKVNYKGKVYRNYINDQNLKIAGSMPKSSIKSILFNILLITLMIVGTLFCYWINALLGTLFIVISTIAMGSFFGFTNKKNRIDKIYQSGVVNLIENSEEFH